MVRLLLIVLFGCVLAAMLAVTTYASLDRSILEVGPRLTQDPWFQATLADAYFGFLTIFVWVAYREPGLLRKTAWFILIMLLGNIAISVYLLIQLVRWDPARGAESLLLRAGAAARRY